jgi:hypothetical protein
MSAIDLNKEFHKVVNGGLGTDYARLAELVEAGADVNSRGHRDVPGSDYTTALAQSIFRENYGLFVFLLDLGADVNYLTRQSGSLPLHKAVYCHKNPAIFVTELLARGADPHLRSLPYNESPYEMARRLGRGEASVVISEMCPLP